MPPICLMHRWVPNFQKSGNLMKVCSTLLSILLGLSLNWSYAQCDTEISCSEHVLTCAEPTVSFGCAVTGNPPFTFAWLDGSNMLISTDSVLTTGIPGAYTLSVTDGEGCEESVQVLVLEDLQAPVCSFLTDVFLCPGGSVLLSADLCVLNPLAYFWSTGTTEPEIEVSNPGTYCVTITGQNGCFSEYCFTVTLLPPMAIQSEIVAQPVCPGDNSGLVAVTVTGGTPPYNYLWSNGSQNTFANGLFPGTYYITVTDINGCFAVDTLLLEPSLQANAGADIEAFCWADTLSIGGFSDTEVYFSGGLTPIEFSDGNQNIIPFTGIPGRVGSDPEVPDWDPNDGRLNLLIGSQSAAVGQTVCLPVRVYDFIDVVSFGFSLNYDTARLRFVEVQGLNPSIPGFSVGGNFGISIPGFPGIIAVSYSNPSLYGIDLPDDAILFTLCFEVLADQTPSSSTGPGITYQWSGPGGFSSTQQFPKVWQSGLYTLRVTDNALPDCWVEDEVEVSFFDSLAVDAGDTLSVCPGFSVALTANVTGGSGNYTYQWNNGATTQTILATTIPSTYIVTVTDNIEGCSGTDEVLVLLNGNLDVGLGPDISICPGAVASLSANYAPPAGTVYYYSWSTGQTNPSIFVEPLQTSTYYLTVTDGQGCWGSDSIRVEVGNLNVVAGADPCDDNGTPLDPSDDTFTFFAVITGGTGSGWSSNLGPTGVYGELATFGPYPVSVLNVILEVIDNDNPGCSQIVMVDAPDCSPPPNPCEANPVFVTTLPTSPSCEGGPDGQILVQVTGGVPPYTYAWAGGLLPLPQQNNLAAGTYFVTVTDVAGCAVADTVTILPGVGGLTLFATITDVSCQGINDGSIQVEVQDGSGSYAYFWSNGSTAPGLSNLPAGSYSITVFDNATGCFASEVYNVFETPVLLLSYNIIQSPQCTASSDGIIEIIVTGGVPPYTYAWSGGNNGPVFTGLPAGNYSITVTDINGCSSIVEVELDAVVQANAGPDQILSCSSFPPFATLDGSNSAAGPTITYTWTGPSGFTSNQAVIEVYNPGTYLLQVEDTSLPGCVDADVVLVGFDDFFHSVLNDPVACDSAILFFNIPNPVYEGSWILPEGDTTTINPYYAHESGTYTLLLFNPETGCTEENAFDIVVDPGACAVIKGRLVRDTLADCVPTPEEPGLQNWLIVMQSNNQMAYAVTQADGSYEQRVLPGDYEVSPILPSALWLPCQDSYFVSVPDGGEMAVLDIPILEQEPCPNLSIDFAMPILRRCWARALVFNYCNNGTAIAEDAYVVLTLDEFFTYQGANVPLIAQNGNQYTFALGDIGINQCGTFQVSVLVSCNAVIGQSLCAEAKIFPNAPCFPPSAQWSGASLRVSGQCEGDEVRFRVENTGQGDMLESSRCIIIEDAVMLMALPDTVLLGSGEFFDYSLPANGSTYRIEVEQVPFHPGPSMPSAVIEGCGANNQGNFSTGFVNQFPLDDSGPYIDIECGEIVAAVDPNDKQGFPRGYGAEHYIYPGTDIEYLVRFQNTGNDTAFLVIIRDTLSEYLDITAVRPGAATHPYTWDIDSTNILVFTFENILLPDSTTNLEGSQGFISFKVSQRDSLPLGTSIRNSAAIYFDINEPVITNTTFHTLGMDFVELVNITRSPGLAGLDIEVSPNPAGGWALFHLAGWPGGQGMFELVNAQGHVVRQQRFSDSRFRFERNGLPAGLYVFRVRDGEGRWAVGKLILR